jgi:hypothetical protein
VDEQQPTQAQTAPAYHAVIVPGGFDPPVVVTADTPAALVELLRTHMSGPGASLCRAYPFAGVRLGIGGDPVRRLVLPDGTALDLTPPSSADVDPEGFLLPPSVRG